MKKTLSDLLSALALKTKSVEDKIAKARNESGDKLDKRIAESKAELQHKKDEFIDYVKAIDTETKAGWDSFKSSVNRKVEHLKSEAQEKTETLQNKVDEKKHELSVKTAEQQYNNAVDYAAACIEWAAVALSEVESATLESFAAKQKLSDLKQHQHN